MHRVHLIMLETMVNIIITIHLIHYFSLARATHETIKFGLSDLSTFITHKWLLGILNCLICPTM